ncbi:MAG: type IV pilus modification protein PilV [Gammaproteobacteria bacterium]|nr:type IV pilus modification protein PilV [Gammaproteobacteria bacterium]
MIANKKPFSIHPAGLPQVRGFTMIEVMVALIILSFGLLGLALMQGQSLKFNTSAYSRTQANLLAYDIIDRMRANPAGVAAGNYNIVATEAAAKTVAAATYTSCNGTNCDVATLANYDLGTWYDIQKDLLPQNNDRLSTMTFINNQVTVTIRWMEQLNSENASLDCSGSAGNSNKFKCGFKEQIWVVEL